MEDLRTPKVSARESAVEPASVHHSWKARLFWPVALAALVVVASSRSQVAAPDITNIDKVTHFLVYGLLATLVCRVGRCGWVTAIVSMLIVVSFGVTDEWHQSFVPGRSSDVGDLIADALGAACAIGLYTRWTWYRRLLEMNLFAREASVRREARG